MPSEPVSMPLEVGWLLGKSSAGDFSGWKLEGANDSARAGGVESSSLSRMAIQASADWDCTGVALDSRSALFSLGAGLAVRLHNKAFLFLETRVVGAL